MRSRLCVTATERAGRGTVAAGSSARVAGLIAAMTSNVIPSRIDLCIRVGASVVVAEGASADRPATVPTRRLQGEGANGGSALIHADPWNERDEFASDVASIRPLPIG